MVDDLRVLIVADDPLARAGLTVVGQTSGDDLPTIELGDSRQLHPGQ